MNSLELFFSTLYQYEIVKMENERNGNLQVVESPSLDMSFDFADAPPAVNTQKENEDRKKIKNREPRVKLSIRKVNYPKQVKNKESEIKPKKSESSKKKKNNLCINMVGYDQKPVCSTRSLHNKRRKME
ncbi:14923_t:CDS:1 [Funneliformis geosporum]|uniref:15870_t:CDS:1 n=1 Tax=Funneliformis geosporum TaxID=1117311 RepID=A0A9W4WTC7_9GLOM|nr:15870_t:CDS:1 [Funneliformis geosporum]CAI2186346.1 14923_t:CDS:1 [Funneliformis geosporum]